MLIRRSIKTRLDLNKAQRELLEKHAGVSRFVYNWGLNRRMKHYRETDKGLTYAQQNRELTTLKRENPWMYETSKWTGQDALRRLDRAFTNFFARCSKYPRFKKKSVRLDSFSFPCWNGKTQPLVKVEGRAVTLPVIGMLRMFEYLEIPGRMLECTISRDHDLWFIAISYEVEIDVPENNNPPVGIDLGIKTLATLSDGTTFENPRCLKKSLKKVKQLQRWVSRKKKGSSNRKKAIKRLAKWHRHVANQRKDTLHKITTHIARNYSIICIENLNVSGMSKNHALAQAILDVGFSEFRRQLEYKVPVQGGEVRAVDRFFPSSKTCHVCGEINHALTLSDREWMCRSCGTIHNRDLNASINIRTVGLTGIACGQEGSGTLACAECETSLDEAGTLRYFRVPER